MDKKILLLSPMPPKSKLQSGISLRIVQVADFLKRNKFMVEISDKITDQKLKQFKNYYALISTKENSISSQITTQLSEDQILIVDLYTPIVLEKQASFNKFKPQDWLSRSKSAVNISRILKRGNHFLVANHRQKIYWLNLSRKLALPIRKSAISILPTVYPSIKITRNKPVKIILWFGGFYPWINPLPLITAFAKVASNNSDWKLRIIGGFYPKSGYKNLYDRIIMKAKEIIPKNQLEILPWISQKDLVSNLADVAFAVHITRRGEEDFLSHRIRLLTLAKYSIPVLTSGTDIISEIFIKIKAGIKIKDTHRLDQQLDYLIRNPKIIETSRANCHLVEPTYLKKELEISKSFPK